jgi:hypothetical protein
MPQGAADIERGGGTQLMPYRSAAESPGAQVRTISASETPSALASCRRDRIPSLENTWCRCHSTVRGLKNRRAPISGFESPSRQAARHGRERWRDARPLAGRNTAGAFRGNLDNWDPALTDALAREREVIPIPAIRMAIRDQSREPDRVVSRAASSGNRGSSG